MEETFQGCWSGKNKYCVGPDVRRSPQGLGECQPLLLPPNGLRPSIMRIGAMIKRYMYLLRSSGVRVVELVYGPFLQMLTWGFLQSYLAVTPGPLARGGGVLIGWSCCGYSLSLQDRLLHNLPRGNVGA